MQHYLDGHRIYPGSILKLKSDYSIKCTISDIEILRTSGQMMITAYLPNGYPHEAPQNKTRYITAPAFDFIVA